MRRSLLAPVLFSALLGLTLPACKPAPPAAAVAAVKSYPAKGVIKGFQSENKVIILQHEKIEGLMEGMTMGFELKDPALAKGLKAGDKVDFTLDVSVDAYVVSSIKKQ